MQAKNRKNLQPIQNKPNRGETARKKGREAHHRGVRQQASPTAQKPSSGAETHQRRCQNQGEARGQAPKRQGRTKARNEREATTAGAPRARSTAGEARKRHAERVGKSPALRARTEKTPRGPGALRAEGGNDTAGHCSVASGRRGCGLAGRPVQHGEQ